MASRSLIAYACVVQEDLIDRGEILAISLPHGNQQPYWGLPHVQVSAGKKPEEAVAAEINRILGTDIRPDQVTPLFTRKPRKRNPKLPSTSPERVLYLVTYTAEQFIWRKTKAGRREWEIMDRGRIENMRSFSWAQKKLVRIMVRKMVPS